jgi:hypothetical protein
MQQLGRIALRERGVAFVVARIERSEIRDDFNGGVSPDFAVLNPGYGTGMWRILRDARKSALLRMRLLLGASW